MDVAHTITHLCAHRGVLEAEIARADADVSSLEDLARRYDIERAAHIATALADIRRLRKEKKAQLADIDQQLELFRLHNAAATKLLGRLQQQQRVQLPTGAFPGTINAICDSSILAETVPPANDTHVSVVSPPRYR